MERVPDRAVASSLFDLYANNDENGNANATCHLLDRWCDLAVTNNYLHRELMMVLAMVCNETTR